MPRIDPKVDYVFKKLFGCEANVDLLIALLNAVLKRPTGEEIGSVQILNPFNDKDALDDKLSILDVKARDQLGRQYNIEMQMVAGPDFQARILYYWAVLHGGQLSEGEDYFELRETISICFVHRVLYPDVPDYHQEFRLRSNRHRNLAFGEQLAIHLVELPKFELTVDRLGDSMEAWCYFLVHGVSLDTENLPAELRTTPVAKAMEVLEMIAHNETDRERYLARLKADLDRNTLLRAGEKMTALALAKADKRAKVDAAKAHEDGLKKGLASQIQLCQQLLKQPLTPVEELLALDLADVQRRARGLESQLGVDLTLVK